ncbi:Ras family GTPase RAS1 [Entamoeba marina]
MASSNQDREFQIMLLGVGGVGKSSLIVRRTQQFSDNYDPTIEDTFISTLEVDRCQIKLIMFEISGYFANFHYNKELFKRCSGLIFVYSISDHESFEELNQIHQQTIKIKDMDVNQFFPIIIAGNKIDLENERQVTIEEGQQLADRWGANFIECSAKNNTNVLELFQGIAQLILENKQLQNETQNKQRHKTNFGCVLC